MSEAQNQPWSRFADAPVVQVVATSPLAIKAGQPLEVAVVDLNMSFWSMVVFMVKWSLASIPAMLILALPLFFGVVFLAGLGARMAP